VESWKKRDPDPGAVEPNCPPGWEALGFEKRRQPDSGLVAKQLLELKKVRKELVERQRLEMK
jgi:hypothetical protein